MRGHRTTCPCLPPPPGTIPAGAGTPIFQSMTPSLFGDYPRGCGDTILGQTRHQRIKGLSPRVRGHLAFPIEPLVWDGTIPAGAGTPSDTGASVVLSRDYPRGCGDTSRRTLWQTPGPGLSPRVRGHLGGVRCAQTRRGTIPAGAGTPAACQPKRTGGRDYPRGCGDTF